MVELTNERMIKYLNNAIFLIDFLKNMLKLIRFNTVPINPIGTIKHRVKISCNQLDLTFERNINLEFAVAFSIIRLFYFSIELIFLDSKYSKYINI